MAKRFRFRFETMLKIRRQREDEHKRIVADRIRQIQEVCHQMASLEMQIREELRAIRSGQEPGRIQMQHVIRHRHWLGRLHKAALDGQGRLQCLEAQLSQERVALSEAVKQRRILEKLKERQWRQHREQQERVEVRSADDVAGTRYVFDIQAIS
jgi:flagellar FliJ protein